MSNRSIDAGLPLPALTLQFSKIDEGTPSAAKAMSTITDIVTHCRFEATAPDSDEVVLATILDVRRIPLPLLPAALSFAVRRRWWWLTRECVPAWRRVALTV
jgi:hypothetical protein